MNTRTEIVATAVHLLATACLLFAAIIHTFPFMLERWGVFITRYPDAHAGIGLFGFVVGIVNLYFIFRKIYNAYSA